jgi:Icc-related predicted phosphoesterase
MAFTFVCDSDLHFEERGLNDLPRPEKDNNVSIIQSLNPDLVIVAGDLTNNGSDGSKICCLPISGHQCQLQAYEEKYVKPLEQFTSVYASMGNHDNWTYFPYVYKAIQVYIIKKYGGINYHFTHKGVQFICLGIYPDADALRFFLKNADSTIPLVLFFHYNLQGPWSDWWTNEEKEAFNTTIAGYNVKLIVTGHIHECSNYTWEGYNVITCGGRGVYKCTYFNNNVSIELHT